VNNSTTDPKPDPTRNITVRFSANNPIPKPNPVPDPNPNSNRNLIDPRGK